MSTTQRSESMNAFFDGYVHSKTFLKLFVEQYERALRTKVEKEFQADFRSFSQMIPCATKYNMEKQFQDVYTITKFREFQQEFTGKVYCDLLSVIDYPGGTKYEVREDIILSEGMKKRIFIVKFLRESCEIECNCHLFEFRGIICKHSISVLIWNDVQLLPEKYVLWRWRRDVSRPYMRVPTTYDGLVCTSKQLRYERLCLAFTKMANLIASNEEHSNHLLGWIESQTNQLCKSNYGNLVVHVLEAQNAESIHILDPKLTKRKGAPRKLCKKSPLEVNSKKSKGRKKVPTSSTLSLKCSRPEENVVNTKNADKVEDHCISSSQTHQLFVTQESVDLIERL
ncbi:protein FAR1-RELATED SEQUENCE 1-like [Olea europaea var. sylvestris]|uniref:protein FAR1-RELATED SEQUENCE 1-like n=1 Tax=Olea europaea var. sylvestris TaxID=158386 RepID=UPI000C1D1865|nr:protein FAR1-RELATED SEQUENCE 1-like [Olea europaea var. sylvestris]